MAITTTQNHHGIKKKILLLYPYYWPFYQAGGPVQSLYNLVAQFQGQAEFYLLSLNRDVDGAVASLPAPAGSWTKGPHDENIRYTAKFSPRFIRGVFADVRPDVVMLNGLFNVETTVPGLWYARVFNARVIVSPRGMLQAWGLKKRRLLKIFFLLGLRAFLRKKDSWHATDLQEVDDIKKHFHTPSRIHLAPNIPRAVDAPATIAFPDRGGKIRVAFLSLINRNKNLHVVIDAVAKMAAGFGFDIYGPVADKDYWAFCQSKIPPAGNITYKGPTPAWTVTQVLKDYHFFVLPTEGENFGHAIFDSLAAGVPVIISKFTPWVELDKAGAGFYVDLDNRASLERILHYIAQMNQAQYDAYRTAASGYAQTYRSRRDFLDEYAFLFS